MKNHAMDNININSIHLERVKSFKCLRSIVNRNNSIEEEIEERTVLGNEAYYANQALFKIRLLSKNSKLKMYWALVRPEVKHACETWILKQTIKQKLLVSKEYIKKNLWTH
jgi:hypothetical protein